MQAEKDDTDRLGRAPRRRLRARLARHGTPGAPLDSVPAFAPTRGRWQDVGDPGALHLSDSEDAAWAEWRKKLSPGVDPGESVRSFGEVDVDLEVVDLTDPAVRDVVGVTAAQLVDDDGTVCRRVAAAARALGLDGVMAPSAALPGAATVVVFPPVAGKATVAWQEDRSPPPEPGPAAVRPCA